MKMFGIELFKNKKTIVMYDFAQHGLIRNNDGPMGIFVETQEEAEQVKKNIKKGQKKIQLTPKGVYYAKSLNADNFLIKNEEGYLDQEIKEAEAKLKLIYTNKNNNPQDIPFGGPVHWGKLEVESIIERLNNRRKINEFKETIDKYPHTTSTLINKIIEENKNLRCRTANEFVPDFPSEAIEAMADYNNMCEKLCGKKTVFYVIADKVDFGEINKRRDPILLAQSPFGFFWQILGAWDEEMKFLEEL